MNKIHVWVKMNIFLKRKKKAMQLFFISKSHLKSNNECIRCCASVLGRGLKLRAQVEHGGVPASSMWRLASHQSSFAIRQRWQPCVIPRDNSNSRLISHAAEFTVGASRDAKRR